jgi:hypothetical protein
VDPVRELQEPRATALLALSLFGPTAAIPAIVTLFHEIVWLVVLQRFFRA